MGRDCMGRVGYGPSLSWAEFVMGRFVQLPDQEPDQELKQSEPKFSPQNQNGK